MKTPLTNLATTALSTANPRGSEDLTSRAVVPLQAEDSIVAPLPRKASTTASAAHLNLVEPQRKAPSKQLRKGAQAARGPWFSCGQIGKACMLGLLASSGLAGATSSTAVGQVTPTGAACGGGLYTIFGRFQMASNNVTVEVSQLQYGGSGIGLGKLFNGLKASDTVRLRTEDAAPIWLGGIGKTAGDSNVAEGHVCVSDILTGDAAFERLAAQVRNPLAGP